MTMINTYGIGAGTAISRQVSDDDERNRQELRRKRKIEHTAEQEFARRLAAERSQHPIQAPTVSPDWQKPFNAGANQNINPNSPGKKKYDTARAQIENSEIRRSLQLPENQSKLPASIESSSSKTEEAISETPASMTQRLASIIEDLSRPSLRAREDRVLSQLEDMMARFRSDESVMSSSEEINEATDYLEFLSGYFEVDQGTHAPSGKILDAVQGLQDQMGQIAEALKIAVSGHLPANLQPSLHTASVRSLHLQRQGVVTPKPSDKYTKEKNVDSEEEAIEASTLASLTNTLNPPPNQPSSRSRDKSSQEKDTDKRKDETLIGITLRSV